MPIPQLRWLAVCAVLAAVAPVAPCCAQFYAKVDYYEASVGLLKDAVGGERQGTASMIGSLASLQDPALLPLFQAMVRSDQAATRVYGVLGCGLATGGTRMDPAAVLALQSAEERAVAVREGNATGLLRGTPVAEILASPGLPAPTVLTLVGEQFRRGDAWDPALVRPITTNEDGSMAGIASLLLLSKGETAPWEAFTTRWNAMTEPTRSTVARAMAEGTMVFEIKPAVEALLKLTSTPGVSDEAQMAAVGTALMLVPPRGLQAWQERVAARRTQPYLVRAGLQLLAADEAAIPASAFEQLRNGTPVLDAIAKAGMALRTGNDPAAALIALLDAGHPVSGEWAMLRARKLPPDQAARVWKHVISTMEAPDPDDRPTALLVSLSARELMHSDPAAVRALVDRARTQPLLAVALLSGVYDSGTPEGADIARALRGSLPRSGESLAALILARSGAPMTDDDMDVLGRAAAGGGDLEAMRAAQAAWFFIKRRDKAPDAIARICGTAPPEAAAPKSTGAGH